MTSLTECHAFAFSARSVVVPNLQRTMPEDLIVPIRLPSATKSVPELLAGGKWVALVHTLGLSPREADVLRCVFSNERIASISAELGISEATVHTYRERLFRKLRVSSCAQLIAVTFATYVEITQNVSREVLVKSSIRRVG